MDTGTLQTSPLADETENVGSNDYAQSHYLLFGGDSSFVYESLNCEDTADYLASIGFSNGPLAQARQQKRASILYMGYHDTNARYCDFCGRALTGTEYEALRDGRERCLECSRSVVNAPQKFEKLFSNTRDNLCLKFGITLPQRIQVKVVSQKRMARMRNSKFVPTQFFDARAVGLAMNRRGRFSMYFENGSPRGSLIATAAHELTHIWQYANWNWEDMQTRYGNSFLAVAEGMAKWVEIQYLYLLNEQAFASRTLTNEIARDDVYGYGLRMFVNQYPLSKGIALEGPTPFDRPDNPLPVDE